MYRLLDLFQIDAILSVRFFSPLARWWLVGTEWHVSILVPQHLLWSIAAVKHCGGNIKYAYHAFYDDGGRPYVAAVLLFHVQRRVRCGQLEGSWESDGANGYNPQSRFAEHTKSCARVKIVPDQTVWYSGFQEGIKRYCTPLSGAMHGEAGDEYNNACPPELQPGFMSGYSLGKRVRDLRGQLDNINSDIGNRQQDTDQAYKDLKTAQDQERGPIKMRIDDNDFNIRRLRRDADDVSAQTVCCGAGSGGFPRQSAIYRPAKALGRLTSPSQCGGAGHISEV